MSVNSVVQNHPICGNYVAFFEDANQIKFGYSTDLNRRLKEHARMARKLGYSAPRWRDFPAPKGVARITETELRQGLKGVTVPGSFEYLKGDSSLFAVMCKSTYLTQRQVLFALGMTA